MYECEKGLLYDGSQVACKAKLIVGRQRHSYMLESDVEL